MAVNDKGTVEAEDAEADMLSILIRDHVGVEDLFSAIETVEDPAERTSLIGKLDDELMRHSKVEEAYLYPVVRDNLPDGAEIAEHELDDHAEVEGLLRDLANLHPRAEEFSGTFEQLTESVRAHVREEEDALFPAVRQNVSAEDLNRLGAEVLRTKASESPPAN